MTYDVQSYLAQWLFADNSFIWGLINKNSNSTKSENEVAINKGPYNISLI